MRDCRTGLKYRRDSSGRGWKLRPMTLLQSTLERLRHLQRLPQPLTSAHIKDSRVGTVYYTASDFRKY